MRPTPMLARALTASGYAGAVAAGVWALLSAFGTAVLTEDPLFLAFCLALGVVMSLGAWMVAGGRFTVTTASLLVLLGSLAPFAMCALLAPYGAGFVAFTVMGTGVALTFFAGRSGEEPHAA